METKEKATAQISYNSKEEICEKNDEINDDNLNDHVKVWKQGKYRDFLLTLNCEIDDNINKSKLELLKKFNNLKKYLLSLKYQYILCSLEKNKRDYYHIHIFIQFDTPHKLSVKKLEGCHINIINKTINKVIDYVQKDGVILNEFGYPRYITGNPSIKDISLSRLSEIKENSNAKFYRVYKEIKKDNQGLYNTPKKLYIKSKLPKKGDKEFKEFRHLLIKDTKIKDWPYNMIIEGSALSIYNIDLILSDYNKAIQYKYYPADIEKILFIIPDDVNKKNIDIINKIKEYTENNKDYELNNEYDEGEIDSNEYDKDDYDYDNDKELKEEYEENYRQSKYYYGENFIERPIEDED